DGQRSGRRRAQARRLARLDLDDEPPRPAAHAPRAPKRRGDVDPDPAGTMLHLDARAVASGRALRRDERAARLGEQAPALEHRDIAHALPRPLAHDRLELLARRRPTEIGEVRAN